MDMNNDTSHHDISIITNNEFLKLGLISVLDKLAANIIITKAIFIDVDSLKLISDLDAILKDAYANRMSVVLICSGGDMSMVFGRLPHIDIRAHISTWMRDIVGLLRSSLTHYFVKACSDLICVEKLGSMKMAIILMINREWSFSLIARTLKISHKTLYRYTGGLVLYFNVRNINFLFYFLRSRFLPSYFDSRLSNCSLRTPLLSFVSGKFTNQNQTRLPSTLAQA
ncbi:hypothetical protein DSM2777_18540 [Obesumbacterium proteus]|nr:hypothetical protein DSM2777_18540 [Obesumbacterium proteus]